jgi:hypothetical protein
MQKREELTQKGQDRSQKTTCRKMGKNIVFREGGDKYIFRTEIQNPVRSTGTIEKKYERIRTLKSQDPT